MPLLFEQLFADEVAPALQDGDRFPEAIAALERMMPRMETREERSLVYHWLANVHLLMATRALSQQDGRARELFDLVEEFFVKAIEEFHWRHDSRVALGRFYLSQGARPDTALECLMPTADPPEDAEAWPVAAYEHQALGLCGTAAALLGQREAALRFWSEAYDPRFHDVLDRGPDLSPLMHAGVCGVQLDRAELQPIMELARAFPVCPPQLLDEVTERLAGG